MKDRLRMLAPFVIAGLIGGLALIGFVKIVEQDGDIDTAKKVQQIFIDSCVHEKGTAHVVAGQYLWCERDGKVFTLHHEEIAIRLLQEGLVEP